MLCQESFVCARSGSNSDGPVTVMSEQSAASPQRDFGYYLCDYPLFIQNVLGLLHFDSHSHGTFGALLTIVPQAQAVWYLKYFFANYYPWLRFGAAGHRAAHI